MKKKNKSCVAFIAHTNYTLFNAINIAMNSALVGKSDLYVIVKQDAMFETINRLKHIRLFNNIFVDEVVNVIDGKNKIKKIKYRVLNFFTFFSPKKYLKLHFGIGCLKYIFGYKEIISSYLDFSTRNMLLCSNMPFLSYFDEGLGSYNHKYGYDYSKFKYKFAKLLFGKSFEFDIKRVYINNIAMFKDNNNYEIIPIKVEKKYIQILKMIFSISNLYSKTRIIFLGQTIQIEQDTLSDVLYSIASYDDYIIRLHQGEDKGEFKGRYSGFKSIIDTSLWELVCYESITNKHILIGYSTTALMTPKVIFEKEPYVIFIFDIFKKHIDSVSYNSLLDYYNKLKLQYSENKVFKPVSITEFKMILSSIYNNGCF